MQRNKTIDSLFIEAATKYPHNIAITYTNGLVQEELTYSDLDNHANQISSRLHQIKTTNTIIAVYSRQIPNLIACLLGILKVPAAFAPVGLEWPPAMAKEFLESLDSSLKCIAVDVHICEEFQQIVQLLDKDQKGSFRRVNDELLLSNGFLIYCKVEDCLAASFDRSLAYVMQTSGTTGTPKTVRVPHRCIVPNITSLMSIFSVTPEDCVALISPYTFDPFVVQLFIALFSGARVAIIPDSAKLQPDTLCTLLFDKLKTSILQPTPSLVYLLGRKHITTELLGQNSSLKVLAFGGEVCPPLHTLRQWKHQQCKTNIFNLYGITEVSSWASCHKISDDDLNSGSANEYALGIDEIQSRDVICGSVPLGMPLDDTVIEVRNNAGDKIDEGTGSIFIGGAKRVCYISEETCDDLQSMRATGDRGYIHNGQIWYCGRQNRQLKRMGKRMNLDWVEQTISRAIPGHDFSALAETSPERPHDTIYLFVKPTSPSDEAHLVTSIEKAFKDSLPVYARPDYIHIVDTIPMTSHGKVDSRKLLSCQKRNINLNVPIRTFLMKAWTTCIGDRTGNERLSIGNEMGTNNSGVTTIIDVLGEVHQTTDKEEEHLCVKNEDKFVECGGTSIAAVRMISQIESWMNQKVGSGVELSGLLDVVLNGTFGDLCRYVERRALEAVERAQSASDTFILSAKSSEVSIDPALSSDSLQNNVVTELLLTTQLPENHGTAEELSDKEDTTSLLPPATRKKKEHNPFPCGTNSTCYCSIQRGMRMTRCRLCTEMGHRASSQHFKSIFDKNELSENEAQLCLQWKVDCHKCIDASPLLVSANTMDRATVYLGSHAHIFKAVQLSDGKVSWETVVGDRIESSATISQCGGFIIVGCYDGKVYIFNREDGTIAWTFQTGGQVKSSPCVDPSTGFVWIGSHDHHLYALDVSRRVCVTSIDCGSSCFSSPYVLSYHHLVFIATLAGRLLAVYTSQMTIKWSRQCPKPVFASPLATSRGVVCACVDGSVYFYGLHGDLLWVFQTSGPVFSSPSYLSCNIVFGSHDGCVYCISDGGRLKWKFTTDSPVYSTPFVTVFDFDITGPRGEISMSDTTPLNTTNFEQFQAPTNSNQKVIVASKAVHCDDKEPVVFVCSTQGTLYCLSLATGRPLTVWSLPGPVFSSPVVTGKHILIGCRDDYLYCLGITMKKTDSR